MKNKFIRGFASLGLLAAASAANAITVDFVNGTWDHSCGGGAAGSTGWDSTYTCGSVSDATLTVTLNMSFVGSAAAHTQNATAINDPTFTGFLMGNQSNSDQNGATFDNYQQWLFSFSTPVPVNGLMINDIDTNGSGNTWRDAVGVETYTGAFGAAGTNDDVVMSLSPTTNLVEDAMTYGLQFVNSTNNVASNQNDADSGDYIVTVNSNGAVDGFAIYLFNTGLNLDQHGVGILGTFDAGPPTGTVPAPGALMLLSAGLLGLRFARRK